MNKHPYTDEKTEYNGKCQNCAYAIFNKDRAGRKIYRIGKCKAKDKYIVSTKIPNFTCEHYKKG